MTPENEAKLLAVLRETVEHVFALEEAVVALRADRDALKSELNLTREYVGEDLNVLIERANVAEGRINGLVETVAIVRDELTSKVNRLEDDDFELSLDELRADIATINYDVACMSQRIDTVEGSVSDLDAELTGLL